MSSLKKSDATILTGYQIFHNDLGPHLALEQHVGSRRLMTPVKCRHDPHGSLQLEDHYDLAEIFYRVESERMLTVRGHPVIRNLYRRFHRALMRSAISCQKVIKGKRRSLRNLVICNYEQPRTPIYTAAASPMCSLDLFGVAGCS
jgi:hypothetical protein